MSNLPKTEPTLVSNLPKTAPTINPSNPAFPWGRRVGYIVFGVTELLDHKPRHLARRREVRVLLTRDWQSRAFCPNFLDDDTCQDWQCPRHSAFDYADAMARHGFDTNGCGHVPNDVRMYGTDGNVCADCWF